MHLVWCVSIYAVACISLQHHTACIRILTKMHKRPNASGWMMHIIILLIDSEYCKYTFYTFICVWEHIMQCRAHRFSFVFFFSWRNLIEIIYSLYEIPFHSGFLFGHKIILKFGRETFFCVFVSFLGFIFNSVWIRFTEKKELLHSNSFRYIESLLLLTFVFSSSVAFSSDE